jgi:hypothetical protein
VSTFQPLDIDWNSVEEKKKNWRRKTRESEREGQGELPRLVREQMVRREREGKKEREM